MVGSGSYLYGTIALHFTGDAALKQLTAGINNAEKAINQLQASLSNISIPTPKNITPYTNALKAVISLINLINKNKMPTAPITLPTITVPPGVNISALTSYLSAMKTLNSINWNRYITIVNSLKGHNVFLLPNIMVPANLNLAAIQGYIPLLRQIMSINWTRLNTILTNLSGKTFTLPTINIPQLTPQNIAMMQQYVLLLQTLMGQLNLLQRYQNLLNQMGQQTKFTLFNIRNMWGGIGGFFADIGNTIFNAAKWAIVYGVIHRITNDIKEGFRIFNQLQFSLGSVMAVGLKPSQVAGATQEGTQDQQYYQRMKDIAGLQAIQFTSQHVASVEQYTQALYELVSANINLKDAMSFVNDAMKVSIAADGNMIQVTRSLAGLYNVFKGQIKGVATEQEKFKQISNVVLHTWAKEQMELQDLNNALKYSANIAKLMGMDYRVLVTVIGHLNTQMIRASTAGTGTRQMFNAMSRNLNEIVDMFGQAQGTLTNFASSTGKAFDPTKPLDFISIIGQMRNQLIQAKGGADDLVFSAQDLAKFFKTFEIRGGNVLATLINTFPELQKKIAETLQLNQDYIDSYVKLRELDPGTQLQIFWKNLKTIPTAFVMGLEETQDLAKAIANINSQMSVVLGMAYKIGISFNDTWKSATSNSSWVISGLQKIINVIMGLIDSIQTVIDHLDYFGNWLKVLSAIIKPIFNAIANGLLGFITYVDYILIISNVILENFMLIPEALKNAYSAYKEYFEDILSPNADENFSKNMLKAMDSYYSKLYKINNEFMQRMKDTTERTNRQGMDWSLTGDFWKNLQIYTGIDASKISGVDLNSIIAEILKTVPADKIQSEVDRLVTNLGSKAATSGTMGKSMKDLSMSSSKFLSNVTSAADKIYEENRILSDQGRILEANTASMQQFSDLYKQVAVAYGEKATKNLNEQVQSARQLADAYSVIAERQIASYEYQAESLKKQNTAGDFLNRWEEGLRKKEQASRLYQQAKAISTGKSDLPMPGGADILENQEYKKLHDKMFTGEGITQDELTRMKDIKKLGQEKAQEVILAVEATYGKAITEMEVGMEQASFDMVKGLYDQFGATQILLQKAREERDKYAELKKSKAYKTGSDEYKKNVDAQFAKAEADVKKYSDQLVSMDAELRSAYQTYAGGLYNNLQQGFASNKQALDQLTKDIENSIQKVHDAYGAAKEAFSAEYGFPGLSPQEKEMAGQKQKQQETINKINTEIQATALRKAQLAARMGKGEHKTSSGEIVPGDLYVDFDRAKLSDEIDLYNHQLNIKSALLEEFNKENLKLKIKNDQEILKQDDKLRTGLMSNLEKSLYDAEHKYDEDLIYYAGNAQKEYEIRKRIEYDKAMITIEYARKMNDELKKLNDERFADEQSLAQKQIELNKLTEKSKLLEAYSSYINQLALTGSDDTMQRAMDKFGIMMKGFESEWDIKGSEQEYQLANDRRDKLSQDLIGFEKKRQGIWDQMNLAKKAKDKKGYNELREQYAEILNTIRDTNREIIQAAIDMENAKGKMSQAQIDIATSVVGEKDPIKRRYKRQIQTGLMGGYDFTSPQFTGGNKVDQGSNIQMMIQTPSGLLVNSMNDLGKANATYTNIIEQMGSAIKSKLDDQTISAERLNQMYDNRLQILRNELRLKNQILKVDQEFGKDMNYNDMGRLNKNQGYMQSFVGAIIKPPTPQLGTGNLLRDPELLRIQAAIAARGQGNKTGGIDVGGININVDTSGFAPANKLYYGKSELERLRLNELEKSVWEGVNEWVRTTQGGK